MIDFLHKWIEQIAVAVIIISIFEMIIPNGKIKKYVKVVLGLFVIFNIISPFINESVFKKINMEEILEDFSSANQTISTSSSNDKIEELYIREIENDISNKIREKGYEVKTCKIDAIIYSKNDKSGINKIDIVLGSKINKKDNSNSNIEKIKNVKISVNNKEEKNEITENEIKELKKFISKHYEIKKNKINIR